MVCRKCNKENDTDALFCKYCGSKLLSAGVCPSCEKQNDEDALFCKYCGTNLNTKEQTVTQEPKTGEVVEKKGLKMAKFVCSIIFMVLALTFMTLNFGACFGNFGGLGMPKTDMDLSSFMNVETSLFSSIENIKSYQAVVKNPVAAYYIMGSSGLFSTIIELVAIAVALIGTFTTLVVGSSMAIYQGVAKKEIANLKKYVALSIGFLASGLLIVALFNMAFKTSMSGISANVAMKFGPLVTTAFWLSFSVLCLQVVYEFVINIIEKKGANSVKRSIFQMIELALLVALIFAITASFITIKMNTEAFYYESSIAMRLQSGGWFTFMNAMIYESNKGLPLLFSFSDYRSAYVLSTICFVFNIALVILIIVFLVKRAANRKQYRSSLVMGITVSAVALVYLVLSICTKSSIKNCTSLTEAIFDSASGKISIGASPIVFFIFSIILLVNEIVGMVLIKKEEA